MLKSIIRPSRRLEMRKKHEEMLAPLPKWPGDMDINKVQTKFHQEHHSYRQQQQHHPLHCHCYPPYQLLLQTSPLQEQQQLLVLLQLAIIFLLLHHPRGYRWQHHRVIHTRSNTHHPDTGTAPATTIILTLIVNSIITTVK